MRVGALHYGRGVDIANWLPGILATLASAGIVALAAYMMPGVRWARHLARDVSILNALPEGDERTAWETRAVQHARRLRFFQDYMPTGLKVSTWLPVGLFVGLIAWAIIDPRQIDGVIAEGPIMIPFVLMAVLNVVLFVMTGVLGLTPEGRSAEELAIRRGLLSRERSSPQPSDASSGTSTSAPNAG